MYYFASDMHLGLGAGNNGAAGREKLAVRWLDEVAADADAIFLVGDIFDFWFEYRRVVPKGFSRLLGKLSELTDRGIQIHFFTGNHDMWVYDYLSQECGVVVHERPEIFCFGDKKVYVAHGDNLYIKRPLQEKIMQWAFRSKAVRRMFSALVHPDLAMRFGQWWSGSSRKSKAVAHEFRGEDEPLVRYARDYAHAIHVDYFVFGHIHCAEDYDLGDGTRIIFLGEWIECPSYAALDDRGNMELRSYCKD